MWNMVDDVDMVDNVDVGMIQRTVMWNIVDNFGVKYC